MRDQAESLRVKMLQSQGLAARSIAVVSGKGGVGKSNFSMNFSSVLASKNKKVMLIDMDIGMGNIHILLGKSVPYNLKDFLEGQQDLSSVIFEGPNGIHYISGGSGLSQLLEWTDTMYERLIHAFQTFQKEYDFILFDMGAGASKQTLDLITAIDEVIVISTAEPTAITDAYSMMKFIHQKDEEKSFFILCNRAFNEKEGEETVQRLSYAMQKFLHKDVHVLGALPEDPIVRQAVRAQTPFSIAYPTSPITLRLKKIVDNFLAESPNDPESTNNNKFLSKIKQIFSRGRGSHSH